MSPSRRSGESGLRRDGDISPYLLQLRIVVPYAGENKFEFIASQIINKMRMACMIQMRQRQNS
jgi:hypothetical protein